MGSIQRLGYVTRGRMIHRILISSLGLLVASFAGADPGAPDWALHMMGSWRGAGVRVEIASRSKTRIESQVETQWVNGPAGGGVVSRNRIKETLLGPNGAPIRSREYDRNYWVQEVSRQSDRVELRFGSGEIPGQSDGAGFSSGVFLPQELTLSSTQEVSGNVRVEFQTQFAVDGIDGETRSLERVWYGSNLHSEGQIRYVRSKF